VIKNRQRTGKQIMPDGIENYGNSKDISYKGKQ